MPIPFCGWLSLRFFSDTGSAGNCQWKQLLRRYLARSSLTQNVFNTCRAEYDGVTKARDKWSALESGVLREELRATGAELRWVHSASMLANSLSKPSEAGELDAFFERGGRWRIVHDAEFVSARRRAQQGLGRLEAAEERFGATSSATTSQAVVGLSGATAADGPCE